MKALILAAGTGQRLGRITAEIPKPMIEIFGKPILEHNINVLKKSGVTDIYINLHHLPEVISNYFESGLEWGVNIYYTYEKELLGTSGALKNHSKFFEEFFFVMYGDNLFHEKIDLKKLIDFHKVSKSDFTIGLCEVNDISLSGKIEFDKKNKVTKIVEKPQTQGIISGFVNAGIYIIEPKILKLIPEGISDFSIDVIPMLLGANYNLYAQRLDGRVTPIDTPFRLNEAINLKG
jgi:NDP-sugar pyrophosphorylase family protein